MKKHQVISTVADVHGVPDAAALRGKFETQLVFGEIFNVEEEKDGWCRGYCEHDGYKGHVLSSQLGKDVFTPTHIVTAMISHAYSNPSIKSPPACLIGFGHLLQIEDENDDFARIKGNGWAYKKHLSPVNAFERGYVATARKFLETPYYWGGRSFLGIDCSGLVQVCLMRAGIKAPRDTEDQEMVLGKAVKTPQAGDLVFFPGHVGIMADDKNLIHANAFHMKVAIEPLEAVAARGKGITSIRRL